MRRTGLLAGAFLTAALVAGSAGAVTVVNGDFNSNTGTGQLGYNVSATGWTVAAAPASYVFLFNPDSGTTSGSSADNGGAFGIDSPPNVQLWGPGTGSANGLTTDPANAGGAFIGADPVFDNSNPAITQTLTGLTDGTQYTVSFDWAAAQQYGFTGQTTEGWTVGFGGATAQSTAVFTLPNEGFSGWMSQSFTFTADGTSDVLSFIADGGPASTLPPFALLDNVSVVPAPVPEPAAWALMLIGVGTLGASMRMRRRAVMVAA